MRIKNKNIPVSVWPFLEPWARGLVGEAVAAAQSLGVSRSSDRPALLREHNANMKSASSEGGDIAHTAGTPHQRRDASVNVVGQILAPETQAAG
jgi:hypothetical protein